MALRDLRRARGISGLSLARSLGVTRQQIANYETGKQRVGFYRIVQISQALNYDPVETLQHLDSLTDDETRRFASNRRVVAASLVDMCKTLNPTILNRKLLREIDEIMDAD